MIGGVVAGDDSNEVWYSSNGITWTIPQVSAQTTAPTMPLFLQTGYELPSGAKGIVSLVE